MTKARDLANAGTALTTVSATELGYLDGVTSAVQTQINTKADATNGTINTPILSNPVLVSPEERLLVSATAASGTVMLDCDSRTLMYFTANASSDWTLNLRGGSSTTIDSKLVTNGSMTVAFLVTNGATAYKHSALTIDGVAQTVKWSGGTAPSAGNASSIDAYSFTIIKTAANTYTVLGAGPIKYA